MSRSFSFASKPRGVPGATRSRIVRTRDSVVCGVNRMRTKFVGTISGPWLRNVSTMPITRKVRVTP
ncbi:hypothetical protein GCM10025794_34600 [Massilia kyonggiensis]